ncbi:DEAD/DEAH box helicase [Streptomyces tirandamycinicus]|uniref:DEAD/DEAH box helicase n=1 Tax=Streptomyces tirandamycinicus TaxID=2174846 RepID=UPI0022705BEB|nr:DEAD/DEAH box helicase [Streptomyces tirandamycinicus]MCY0982266.1 DEAD/DEAH box helicase [Streptomyces tirandamycinicus]
MTRSARPARPARGRPAERTAKRAPKRPGGARPATAPQDFTVPEPRVPALPAVGAFEELTGLPAALLKALAAQGVTAPFPIQAATLPNSLAGRDLLGRGRTGSGKTLAFGLALLARTAGRRAEPGAPLGLVLVPTRELAQQVTDALSPYATAVNLRLATVVGGLSITKQATALRRGAEVLVATPGRLQDLVERGDCRLGEVAITVLDEADQMADMGFLPQVTALLKQVDPDGQRMLFSATLDRNIDRLVRGFLSDPVVHSVDPSAGAVTTMEHHVLHVADETDKKAVTVRIAARDGRVILFLDTKRSVDRLVKRLLASGVRAAGLHGGRSQPQRNRTLDQFKNGQVSALVATNVAARGIHVDDLDLVVNVDPPTDHKDYLHRGGRTARAGESGSVVTLVLPDQKREMTRLMSDAGISPRTVAVRSSDEELARLTGAREPSGVAVTVEAPPAPQPPAAKSRPKRRRPRGGGGRADAVGEGTGGRTGGGRGDGGRGDGGRAEAGGRRRGAADTGRAGRKQGGGSADSGRAGTGRSARGGAVRGDTGRTGDTRRTGDTGRAGDGARQKHGRGADRPQGGARGGTRGGRAATR